MAAHPLFAIGPKGPEAVAVRSPLKCVILPSGGSHTKLVPEGSGTATRKICKAKIPHTKFDWARSGPPFGETILLMGYDTMSLFHASLKRQKSGSPAILSAGMISSPWLRLPIPLTPGFLTTSRTSVRNEDPPSRGKCISLLENLL